MKIPDEFMQTNEEYNSSRRGSVDVAAFKVKIQFTAKMNFDIYTATHKILDGAVIKSLQWRNFKP